MNNQIDQIINFFVIYVQLYQTQSFYKATKYYQTRTIMSIIIAALQDVIILGEIIKKQQSSYREEADIYCEE